MERKARLQCITPNDFLTLTVVAKLVIGHEGAPLLTSEGAFRMIHNSTIVRDISTIPSFSFVLVWESFWFSKIPPLQNTKMV